MTKWRRVVMKLPGIVTKCRDNVTKWREVVTTWVDIEAMSGEIGTT